MFKTSTSFSQLKQWLPHALFGLFFVVCLVWISAGVIEKQQDGTDKGPAEAMVMDHSTMTSNHEMPTARVDSKDEAVRAYLRAAAIIADIYQFNNGGSYAGLCENSDALYTLEGESGGILKYIKFVGATEVFCSTREKGYLIEAKMPENGRFFCIDHVNGPVEGEVTREGEAECR